MNDIDTLKKRVELLENVIADLVYSDRYIFQKNVQLMDGRNMQFGLGTGTKIGTATTQKLSFYGVTPIVQQGAIASPAGGLTVDAPARAGVDSIRAVLTAIGITA